ncbi:hypothetical protein ACJMK2_033011 [Sinanodonta woodiana]|uniref:Uncharacterized protein n=1 Tax=Sinanodonta woodiana TaxID=1069815 RepID=A0ABD3X5Q1_SINWO
MLRRPRLLVVKIHRSQIWLPTQTLYPARNGPIEKAPEVPTKLFYRMGQGKWPTWTTNHDVPHGTTEYIVQNTEHFMPNDIRAPVTDRQREATFLIKIYRIYVGVSTKTMKSQPRGYIFCLPARLVRVGRYLI